MQWKCYIMPKLTVWSLTAFPCGDWWWLTVLSTRSKRCKIRPWNALTSGWLRMQFTALTKYSSQMIELEMSKLGFHLVNNLLPNQLSKALQTDHCNRSMLKTHRYNTRLRAVPNLPKATHSRYRNSYLFQALSIYSKLPATVINQTNLKAFAGKCKAHILERENNCTT